MGKIRKEKKEKKSEEHTGTVQVVIMLLHPGRERNPFQWGGHGTSVNERRWKERRKKP